MALLDPGYWHTTYWALNYWNPDYWLHYGTYTPPDLLDAGYWQTTYWARGYWNPDYWLHYGTYTPPPPTQEVSIWLEPRRKRRLPLPRDLLETIQEYLELEVKQNA